MTNITNLIVTNITVRSCLGNENDYATVLIEQCTNVQLRHVVIEESHNSYGIVGINILGDSHFSYITNNAIIIIYDDTTVDMENHSLTIDHYHVNDVDRSLQNKMTLLLHQLYYSVKIQLLNSKFQWIENDFIISVDFNSESIGKNTLLVKYCQFTNNNMPSLQSTAINSYHNKTYINDSIWFQNCEFFNNEISESLSLEGIIDIIDGPNLYVNNCSFHHNTHSPAITKRTITVHKLFRINITIANTVFSSSTGVALRGLLFGQFIELHLQGPVIFYNISSTDCLIRLHMSDIICSNYIEFSNLTGRAILEYIISLKGYEFINMFVKGGTVINITHNDYKTFAFRDTYSHLYETRLCAYKYPSCYFQYISDPISGSKDKYGEYSIIFKNNYGNLPDFAYNNLPLTHCSWLPWSAFNATMPPEVNEKYIQYIDETGVFNVLPQYSRQKTLCYCDTNNSFCCYKEMLDPIYPGQTMLLNIYADLQFDSIGTVITVVNNIKWLQRTACSITDSSQMIQYAKSHTCTKLKYTIAFHDENWCELYLRDDYDKVDVYYVTQKPCPAGFIKYSGMCQCYPFLYEFGIKCNVDDQTIQRPANGWILPMFQNNTYKIFILSLHCPFHYCLPHSSHLKFSTPNSQCQFNRSGIVVYCVDIVNKVSVLYLAHLNVNNVRISTYF